MDEEILHVLSRDKVTKWYEHLVTLFNMESDAPYVNLLSPIAVLVFEMLEFDLYADEAKTKASSKHKEKSP